MLKSLYIIFPLLLTVISSSAQKNIVRFGGEYISFGTGDNLGWGMSAEYSRLIIKKNKLGLNNLYGGIESIVEIGNKQPKDPNSLAYFSHENLYTAWGKITYYPLNKIISGLYLSAGPTIGFHQRTFETHAWVNYYPFDNRYERISTIAFQEKFSIGYRLSLGIDIPISKTIFAGARIDFANNQYGDMNSILGLGVGVKF